MSYRLAVTATSDRVFPELDVARAQSGLGRGNDPEAQAVNDQLDAAFAMLDDVVAAVGRDTDSLMVEIEGHANPAHAPRVHYAHESLTIRVAVVGPADGGEVVHDPGNATKEGPRGRGRGPA